MEWVLSGEEAGGWRFVLRSFVMRPAVGIAVGSRGRSGGS